MSDNDRDRIQLEGEVIDANKGQFRVKLDNGLNVLATLSGKIRTNSVKILLGDRVLVEVSQYDTSRGRIIYRMKGN